MSKTAGMYVPKATKIATIPAGPQSAPVIVELSNTGLIHVSQSMRATLLLEPSQVCALSHALGRAMYLADAAAHEGRTE